MKPPSCDAAKSTVPLPATSMRCAADSFVHVIAAPASAASRSASRLTETGSASRAPGAVLADELHEHEQRLLGARAHALVVDDRRGLAVGVEHVAEVGTRRAHEIADHLDARVEVLARRAGAARRSRTGSPRARSHRSWRARSASRSTPRRTSSRARP